MAMPAPESQSHPTGAVVAIHSQKRAVAAPVAGDEPSAKRRHVEAPASWQDFLALEDHVTSCLRETDIQTTTMATLRSNVEKAMGVRPGSLLKFKMELQALVQEKLHRRKTPPTVWRVWTCWQRRSAHAQRLHFAAPTLRRVGACHRPCLRASRLSRSCIPYLRR